MRILFADEARFGRINRPRPCWAPIGIRPEVASQLIREYIYLYGAVSPKDGTCVYLIMPRSDTACFQVFLNALSRKFARQDILLVLDGAPNHRCRDLVLPGNISLLFLPPYSPELNPKENLWEEIREKIFKNYALKSIDAVSYQTPSPWRRRRLCRGCASDRKLCRSHRSPARYTRIIRLVKALWEEFEEAVITRTRRPPGFNTPGEFVEDEFGASWGAVHGT